jgi:hypothetical protein
MRMDHATVPPFLEELAARGTEPLLRGIFEEHTLSVSAEPNPAPIERLTS